MESLSLGGRGLRSDGDEEGRGRGQGDVMGRVSRTPEEEEEKDEEGQEKEVGEGEGVGVEAVETEVDHVAEKCEECGQVENHNLKEDESREEDWDVNGEAA